MLSVFIPKPQTRFICLGLMALLSSQLHAEAFPRGCEVTGFNYSNQYLILNVVGDQTIYFIQNRSNRPIRLERHETRDVFISPKLEANIAPGYWSAFASDEKGMNFQCAYKNDAQTIRTNCADVLEVCQYPRAKFALSNMGNYWVSTNKPQALVVKEAVGKGVYLKW